MSSRLHHWLSAPNAAWLDPADTPLAMATLLVRMARDNTLADLLRPSQIDHILAQRYDLTLAEAGDMRRASEGCATVAPRTEALARLMRLNVPQSERALLAVCLQNVLHASGTARGASGLPTGAVARILGIDAQSLVPPGNS
ncbi:hypothetical protein [Puniceibacterium confluentis]|uniref:hypothetical protein n=1 Tax=Puniceibacterium confluentis TaxID=1958944 RepID=UPI0011B4A039|nr:hypothetical protein [Puniceibacterium confluentis]